MLAEFNQTLFLKNDLYATNAGFCLFPVTDLPGRIRSKSRIEKIEPDHCPRPAFVISILFEIYKSKRFHFANCLAHFANCLAHRFSEELRRKGILLKSLRTHSNWSLNKNILVFKIFVHPLVCLGLRLLTGICELLVWDVAEAQIAWISKFEWFFIEFHESHSSAIYWVVATAIKTIVFCLFKLWWSTVDWFQTLRHLPICWILEMVRLTPSKKNPSYSTLICLTVRIIHR